MAGQVKSSNGIHAFGLVCLTWARRSTWAERFIEPRIERIMKMREGRECSGWSDYKTSRDYRRCIFQQDFTYSFLPPWLMNDQTGARIRPGGVKAKPRMAVRPALQNEAQRNFRTFQVPKFLLLEFVPNITLFLCWVTCKPFDMPMRKLLESQLVPCPICLCEVWR